MKNPTVAELNGSPTDNNATLFANGYNSVLDPKYASGDFKKGPNQSVPDWDNQKALTIFEQMLQQTNNKIDGVLAANDGLANSVISAINARKLKSIPVTGQDATAQGIQHILAGEQCMTVYKAVKAEADAAAKLAIALAKGQTPTTNASDRQQGDQDPVGAADPGGGDQVQHQGHGHQGRLPQAQRHLRREVRVALHARPGSSESMRIRRGRCGVPSRLERRARL